MNEFLHSVQFGVREVWPEFQVVDTLDIETVESEVMTAGPLHYSF